MDENRNKRIKDWTWRIKKSSLHQRRDKTPPLRKPLPFHSLTNTAVPLRSVMLIEKVDSEGVPNNHCGIITPVGLASPQEIPWHVRIGQTGVGWLFHKVDRRRAPGGREKGKGRLAILPTFNAHQSSTLIGQEDGYKQATVSKGDKSLSGWFISHQYGGGLIDGGKGGRRSRH